jgi:L,D-peptidoglycan transpeptidase YkuD (ErfK/YbiS/YcfS/YnhG family)
MLLRIIAHTHLTQSPRIVKQKPRSRVIYVARKPGSANKAIIYFGSFSAACSVGANGLTTNKREQDRKTPIGVFNILWGFRLDERWHFTLRHKWFLPVPKVFGWCDSPSSPNYNRGIRVPSNVSHEVVYRSDSLYDSALVLDYNVRVRSRNRGSAIFLHIANNNIDSTEGCIALSRKDFVRLSMLIRPGDKIRIR